MTPRRGVSRYLWILGRAQLPLSGSEYLGQPDSRTSVSADRRGTKWRRPESRNLYRYLLRVQTGAIDDRSYQNQRSMPRREFGAGSYCLYPLVGGHTHYRSHQTGAIRSSEKVLSPRLFVKYNLGRREQLALLAVPVQSVEPDAAPQNPPQNSSPYPQKTNSCRLFPAGSLPHRQETGYDLVPFARRRDHRGL